MRLPVAISLLTALTAPCLAQPFPLSAETPQPKLTADSANLSVFDVFKTVCIETDIRKALISEKALSLGALPFKEPDNDVASALYRSINAQVDRAAWLVGFGGREFEVYFKSTHWPASPPHQSIHADQCHVIFRGDDVQGINEMVRWVGISDGDAIKSTVIDSTRYEFQVVGGKRVPLLKSWRVDPRFSNIVTWQAEVSRSPVTSLILERKTPLN